MDDRDPACNLSASTRNVQSQPFEVSLAIKLIFSKNEMPLCWREKESVAATPPRRHAAHSLPDLEAPLLVPRKSSLAPVPRTH